MVKKILHETCLQEVTQKVFQTEKHQSLLVDDIVTY